MEDLMKLSEEEREQAARLGVEMFRLFKLAGEEVGIHMEHTGLDRFPLSVWLFCEQEGHGFDSPEDAIDFLKEQEPWDGWRKATKAEEEEDG